MTFVVAKPASVPSAHASSLRSAAPGQYGGKRLLDILLVLLAMPLLLPLIAVLAALVALDGSSPFFRQHRIGRDGRIFRMIKFRSMVPDAESQLKAYLDGNEAAWQEWHRFQKLSDDPRVTPFGRLLRRTSLDELPQFFNVLTGDMSLVGPRPMMPEQARIYPGTAYYRMRPGITGPWQVSQRNDASFTDRAVFDLHYLETQSFSADLAYLARTAGAVVRMSGR